MKTMLVVCLLACAVITSLPSLTLAQSPPLQKGISVQMANTDNASPMPAADSADAWIVAITRDGSLYFGADPVTPESLADTMRRTPRNREAKLYVKADARVPFARVERVLEIGRAALFAAPVLLTAQVESPAPGTIVPPKGLEVLVGVPPNAASAVVQISSSQPTLKVNDQEVSPAALQGTLRKLLQSRSRSVVLVKAEGTVPFAEVAHAIDACSSVGATAAVPAPQL